mgnify:CR=1 FL=1
MSQLLRATWLLYKGVSISLNLISKFEMKTSAIQSHLVQGQLTLIFGHQILCDYTIRPNHGH